MISEGMETEITEDTRLKGEATPGTNTPCVDVPKDQIENPDGKVVGKSVPQCIYELRQLGREWKNITKELGVKSPWLKAKKYATDNGLEYPPPVHEDAQAEEESSTSEESGVQESVSDATESEPFPEEKDETQNDQPSVPASMPPVLPTYKIYDLAVNKEIEKTSLGHTHTLEFRIGTSTVRLGLHGAPTDAEVQKMMARENRRVSAGR